MPLLGISPLVASTPERGANDKVHKIYLREEASFAKAIADNLREKYAAWCGKSAELLPFEFAFDAEYLRQAGGFDSRKVTRALYFGKTGIRGIQAPFLVRGSRELIALGWDSGFGEANSQGFGMAG